MNLLYFIIGIFFYVNIGLLFAHFNVWAHSKTENKKFLAFIFWPLEKLCSEESPIERMSEASYKITMCFFGPLKIVWNLYVVCIMGLVTALLMAGVLLAKILTKPVRMVTKINSIDKLKFRNVLPSNWP